MPKPRAAPKKINGQTPAKADWEREQLSLRLTPARRERLLRVASDMPAGTTPGEAVDRAIERALAPATAAAGDGALARLDALEELLASLGRERARDASSARAASDKTLREVRAVAWLMSAVAAAPGGDDEGLAPVSRDAQSLRAWLDERRRPGQGIVAVGRWHSKTRLADGNSAVEFEIAMQGSSARSVVALPSLPSASPLARVHEDAAIRFSCALDASGRWSVDARLLNQDRAEGGVIGSLRV